MIVVYDDGSGATAIVCNCCGAMWTEDETCRIPDDKNDRAHEAERIANKNGWLIHFDNHFHICDKCAILMVNVSYDYHINR